ncbi:unnamed protein product [Urochloa decumbens]|uniref:Uncharacterized protein n=1 Tax=Urochloa decumbens TaxID=240449 RepID=A0ABC8WZL1_9POAL
MEAAPSAKPPPVPPNYVSLRDLQELRLKEKEEQERRRREEEEAAAAAAARREAEKAAMASAIKREAEAKRRAASWEASGGAKERERHRAGKAQGQGNQWVAVAHRAPASTPRPVAAGKREAATGGGRGEKGPDDAPHGGGNPRVKAKWKGKGKGKVKEKLAEALPAPSYGGKPAEVVPASPCGGGKPENKSESNSKAKGKDPGNQAAESSLSGGPAEAAISSSRDRARRGRPAGAGVRSGAETCTGIAPAKAAGSPPPPPPPPRGVRSDDTGKPKRPAPRRADAVVAGGGSPVGKKAGPAQVPPASAADGSSKPASGGELRKTVEVKPGGLVEGKRRRQVGEAQAIAAELNPRVARCSFGPLRGRGNEPVQQHGRVWVPKAAAAGSSAGAGL